MSNNAVGDHIDRFPLGFSSFSLIKQKIKDGDKTLLKDLEKWTADADRILKIAPPSVMDNTSAPDGVGPHDYISYAPYWWPNPETKNGLPYVRRDGQINTDLRAKGDCNAFMKMALSVHNLSLAYYYCKTEHYSYCYRSVIPYY